MTIGNYNNQQKIRNNQRYAIMMMTETDDTVQMRIIRMAKCRKIIIVHVDANRAEWNGMESRGRGMGGKYIRLSFDVFPNILFIHSFFTNQIGTTI